MDWDELLTAARPLLAELYAAERDPGALPVFAADPSRLDRPLPAAEGAGWDEVLAELRDVLAAGRVNGAHPGFLGYFHPRPLPAAVLGDAIASLLNQSPAAHRLGPAAAALEARTGRWLARFLGYPGTAVFTSGGSTANLAGLKLARDAALPSAGTDGVGSARLACYASVEAHYSVSRALDVLGVGRRALRLVGVDAAGRLSIPALRAAVAEDVAEGVTPMCVVGLAGATATGAVDPLDALADVCAEHGMRLHVDGAAGVPYAGVPATRDLFRGLDRADSVAVDPHKWLFTPYGLGCVLVRDVAELARSYAGSTHYWRTDAEMDTVGLTVEGARPWKSLGLWLAARHLGDQGWADLLTHTLDLARRLADGVRKRPGLELLAEPTLPVCCFRPVGGDDLVEEVCRRLLDSGRFYLTTCRPDGSTWLRASFNNWSAGPEAVDALLEAASVNSTG